MTRLEKMILRLEKYALHVVVGLVVLICVETIAVVAVMWAVNN